MSVDSELVSSIGKGLLVFAGIGKEDTEKETENLVNKVLKAKFWPDDNGAQVRQSLHVRRQQLTPSQWKKNVKDIGGEILCGMIPNLYTLHVVEQY